MLAALTPADKLCRCPKHALQKLIQPCDEEIWTNIQKEFRPFNVFVNIPYLKEYQKLQAVIIATVLKVGLRPKLASFRSEGQPIRMCKICEIMQTCKYCITDLSYQRLHNMPFELGFFLALGRQGHSFILIDKKYVTLDGKEVRKFDAQMSNLKSVEVLVHDNDPKILVTELLKRFKRDVPEAHVDGTRAPLAKEILKLAKKVEKALEEGTPDEFVEFWDELASQATEPVPTADGATAPALVEVATPTSGQTPKGSQQTEP